MQELTASIESVVASASSLAELEEGVFDLTCAYARLVVERALARRDDALASDTPKTWRCKDRRPRSVLTRIGEVRFTRRRYVDQDGLCRFPLDEQYGLAPRTRVSPSLERLLIDLSSSVSFREASRIVSVALRAHVSHQTAHDLLSRAGTRLSREADAAASDLHDLGLAPAGDVEVARLHCEADGTVIALQGESTRRGEVKLAVFYADKSEGLGAVHAGVCPSAGFWRAASAAAGAHYDLSQVREVIVAGDGAQWVKKGTEVFPGARYQLDPFHIIRALLRATGEYGVATRVFSAVYEHGLAGAVARLRAFGAAHPERETDIERVIGYLESNASGLWRSDPGCGSIEGHIDKILANRLKKRGRRWSKAGADRMAHVLAANRSGRPIPVGRWQAPQTRDVVRPLRPIEFERTTRTDERPPQGHVVSNRTGHGFTRTLRDISGARKADY